MAFNPWHDVTIGADSPDIVNAIIEIPKGSKAKYEIDKETEMLRLDRVLYSSVYYPANYGFIPRTLGKDRDPLGGDRCDRSARLDTTAQLADRLRITPARVRQMILDGVITGAEKVGRDNLIPEKEAQRLEQAERKTGPPRFIKNRPT